MYSLCSIKYKSLLFTCPKVRLQTLIVLNSKQKKFGKNNTTQNQKRKENQNKDKENLPFTSH